MIIADKINFEKQFFSFMINNNVSEDKSSLPIKNFSHDI